MRLLDVFCLLTHTRVAHYHHRAFYGPSDKCDLRAWRTPRRVRDSCAKHAPAFVFRRGRHVLPLRKCASLREPFQIFILYRGLNYYACNSKLLVGVTENLFLTVSTLRHTGATLLYRVPLHYCLSIRTVLLVLSLVWV